MRHEQANTVGSMQDDPASVFERLLMHIVSSLSAATPQSVDHEMRSNLRQTAEFFGAEGAFLFSLSQDDPQPSTICPQGAKGAAALCSYGNLDALPPRVRDTLLQGDIVSAGQAGEGRGDLQKLGVGALVAVPIAVKGVPKYGFMLAWARSRSGFPDKLLSRLRLLADLFGGALIRTTEEENARKAEFEYRTIADFTNDWEYWLDPKGQFRYISEPCERISGYRADEFIHDAGLLDRIVHPEDRDKWTSHNLHQSVTRQIVHNEFRLIRKDGAVRWIDHICQPVRHPQGDFLGYRASNRDITERKLTEIELLESRTRLAEAQRIAQIGNWEWSLVSDNLKWSEEVYRIVGLQPDQLGGSYNSFLEWVHAEDREALQAAVMRTLRIPESQYECQYRVVRPDGSIRFVHERGVVKCDAAGRPAKLVGTLHDITNLKVIEQEARQLRDRLNHLDRVATLSMLSAALAHEINQPLAAILNNAQAAIRLMSAGRLDLLEVRAALEDITSDAKRAGEIIYRLRTLLKRESPKRETFDINLLVREVLSLVRSETVIRNVELSARLDDSMPLLYGDRIQVQQVVLNLLMNALEAVESAPAHRRRILVKTGSNDPSGVEVAVMDSGPGIPAQETETVFQVFYSSKPHGTGFGLAICRSIVEAHGGRIWASNNPDQGACFTFRLPVEAPVPAPGSAAR